MLRLRLILAWLVMAALPLQGWAAASMLFCGPASQAAVHSKAHAAKADEGHQGLHAGHHDMHAAHTQHQADSGGAEDGAPPVADSGHTCSVCAACSHGIALAQTPRWPTVSPPPAADIAEPLAAVLARPSPVPDKPPRA
jgi:hypothetical protein